MDDRFDFQMVTGNLNDGRGTAYISNSYQAFGNNGSHQVDQPLNSGSGADANTLFYLSSIIDHLPIVADYQLPARMNVAVATVPERVIVDAAINVEATVTNSAPVQFSNGADKLDYSINGQGDVTGSAGGSNLSALTPGNVHSLSIDTTSPGVRAGTLNATSTSEAVANGSFNQAVSTTVLAHATPSFDADAIVDTATIDFGIRGRGLGGATASFSVSNLDEITGFTAALDLDSISAVGDVDQLTTNASTFSNLAAGGSIGFSAAITAISNGKLSVTYTLNLSDEDLPGAITRGPLTLVLSGIVATPGDSDLNNVIDFDDYAHIDYGFNNNLSGWFNGDFDSNGVVNFDDYALIDASFNNQEPAGMQAVPEPAALVALPIVAVILRRRMRTSG